MKKHLLPLILSFSLALGLLAGCGTPVSPDPTPQTQDEGYTTLTVTAVAPLSEDEQRALLEQNRELWGFSDPYDSPWFYTFTDLDRNGRLEALAATTQGSGMFTYAHFYEVTPDCTGLDNCWHKDMEIEGPDDWPEIVLDTLDCYADSAAGLYWYPCENLLRDGFRHQHSAWYALCLKDGVADWELLASKDVEYDDSGENPSVVCLDAQGNAISEADYDSAVERRFAGLARSTLALSWTRVDEPQPEALVSEPVWTDEPAATSPTIVVTKHPSSEAITVGGKNWFIAHAQNADSLTWQLVDPDGAVYSLEEAMAAHPGLLLEALAQDTLAVSNVPLSLNGWGVRARFDSADGFAETESACIYVGDFTAQYGGVIASYQSVHAAGLSDSAAYMTQNGLSEMTAYSEGLGYTLKDLDKNGVPELLIFGMGIAADYSKNVVYDCYTLWAGQPVQLACSHERERFYLRTDSSLLSMGAGGASHVYNAVYRLESYALSRQELLFTDLDANGSMVWYSRLGESETLPDENCVAISEQTYQQRLDAIQSTVYLPPLTKIY